MPYRDVAKHRMLNHLVGNAASGAAITQISLHSNFPATDANELSGGSPAYARKSPTWTAAGAEGAGRVDHGSVTFDVPAGATVSAVAYRTAAGDIYADGNVTDEVFAAQGTYTVTDASWLDLNAAT